MTMDRRGLGAALWRQRVLVALVVLVTAASATVGVWAAPRSYSATATLSAPAAPGPGTSEGELDAMRATLAASIFEASYEDRAELSRRWSPS